MKSLAKGINKAAKQYGITIIGGDTIANSKLDLSITIISHTLLPVYRKGLKKGDLIIHTGVLGKVKKDLDVLLGGGKVSSKSRFIRPVVRDEFFYKAAPYVRVALDISDGLFAELERLSSVNKCGFVFDHPVKEGVGCSGEEYEILFGCDPSNIEAITIIANETNTPLTIVGKVTKGEFISPCKSHHFSQ
jgi:thiamine-monophosphate kinase